MNHEYDRHAKKCFGMEENRNKKILVKFYFMILNITF